MKQLRKTKRPVILTGKRKAAAIVQDAAAYQRLLDIAARADAEEGIRQGLEDSKQGRVQRLRGTRSALWHTRLDSRFGLKRDLAFQCELG